MKRSSKIIIFLTRYNLLLATVTLLIASLYFFVGAIRMKAVTKSDNPLAFSDEQIVNVIDVIDGDELLIEGYDGVRTRIRLYGIDSFNAEVNDPKLLQFGKTCVEYIRSVAFEKKVKIKLSEKIVGNKGRLLGRVLLPDGMDDYTIDLGKELIRKGYTLVYTRYDYPDSYLAVQETAKANNVGFWVHKEIRQYISKLTEQWEIQKAKERKAGTND